jgi:hypothetical protein
MKKMQGIVLEVRKRHVILLTPDGDFQKAPHPGGSVKRGDEVCCRLTAPPWPKAAAAAACLAAAVLVLIAVFPPGSPFSGVPGNGDSVQGYLVFDINPSFELAFNSKLEVTACRPLNEPAVSLLEGWRARRPLDDTIAWLLERSVAMGFLDLDLEHNLVLVTLVRVGSVEITPEPLAELIEEKLSRLGVSGYVGIFETEAQARAAAVTAGLSLNRYLLMEALRRQGIEDLPGDDSPLADLLRKLNGTLPGGLFRATGKPGQPPQFPPGSDNPPGRPDLPPDPPEKPDDPGKGRMDSRPGLPPPDTPGSGDSPGHPGAPPSFRGR